MFCLCLFFQTESLQKIILSNMINAPHSLYPKLRPNMHFTDLDSNCLQKLSADEKSRRWQAESYFWTL